ncbi:MAG: aminotransferase class I/II-fold pyridoxal phosphate-dependent enzyme [Chloroflexi bacterium]|nr:aminotransferase class I/II-fold pyridoxal phosphate-dependent enzyme [Chloroflexota bacterium]
MAVAQGSSTVAVHAGTQRPNAHHALTPPVVQTATYTFADTADLCDFMDARMWGAAKGRTEYGRYGNPTVTAAETKLAALEGAQAAVLYSSGMAAVTSTLLTLLQSGSHVVITDDSYRRTRQFCLNFLRKFGVECTVSPMGDYEALEAAIRPTTKLIISESPTNPYLRVLDLGRVADIAKRHNVRTLVDATFATPLNLRPLDFGIDLVVHSATKYLGGHNDLLAGVVAGSEQLIALLRQNLWMLGGVLDPNNAYLLVRGLKTLALRLQRQNENGIRVAQFLESHPKVERVWYPGLASHPDHEAASRQMSGFGGVISFEVKGDLSAASRVVDGVRIPIIAPSLGGVETLIEQPALMSYYEMSTEERLEVGIKDNLIRLALGIEDADDLIADLSQSLDST